MALPINISELLNGTTVEWERIEFKESFNPEGILHTICAFANDFNNWGGGYIIVGIAEKNGQSVFPPKGIPLCEIDNIQKEFLRICNLLRPAYFPVAEPVEYMGVTLLVIWAYGGQTRPYQAPIALGKDRKEMAYYIRHFSNTVKAKNGELRELISLAGTVPFDDRINQQASISDLNLTLIKAYLHDVKSSLYNDASKVPFDFLCRQMNIIEGAEEYIRPKNIGILLFNDQPHRFIPMCQIELVHFDKNSTGDRLTEKIFTGPLHQQVRDVLRYIKNMIIKERVIKVNNQAESCRWYNFPYEALEESIANLYTIKAMRCGSLLKSEFMIIK